MYSFYWLAPCFLCCFQQSSSSVLTYNPSSDSGEQKWNKKKMWGFSLDTSCLSRRKRKHHVSDWSLSLTFPNFSVRTVSPLFSPRLQSHYRSVAPRVRLVSHLKLSPHPPVSQSEFPWGHKQNLTTGTFVLWVPVSVRCNSLKMSLVTTGRRTHMKGGATRLELVLQAQHTELKYSWSHVSLLILTPHGVWHTAIWNILVTVLV